jgi:hypothetical protein
MIIGLSGYARSGKDTVADWLCLNYGYTRLSFAQPMRDAIYTLNPMVEGGNRVADLVDEYGWDIAKSNPEVRRLLQVFGTDVGRKQFGDNFWVQQAFDKIEGTKIVFSDVRTHADESCFFLRSKLIFIGVENFCIYASTCSLVI